MSKEKAISIANEYELRMLASLIIKLRRIARIVK
jgi:hypothetical protein